MYIEIGPGEALAVGLRETDGVFVIDYAKSQSGVIAITADCADTTGREGVIYEDHFVDAPDNPDAQLLNAIRHGHDEDIEGRVVSLDRLRQSAPVVPVSQIDREREELDAIADMLRAANTREAVVTAYHRLQRQLGV
ncbi:MAG: hypothetical protein DI537_47130 [Stutzerimonas stutzeri]|nr:MAG: hypothetical protein DI537_47130 [Stutzerimonas stutzeri]